MLIVEDDEDARWLLKEVLYDAGFDAAGVATGREALAVLRAGARPCVILLDSHKPVTGGPELMRNLAQSPWSGIPIVLLTAEWVLTRLSGARVVLKRPVDSVGLTRVLAQFCSHRRP